MYKYIYLLALQFIRQGSWYVSGMLTGCLLICVGLTACVQSETTATPREFPTIQLSTPSSAFHPTASRLIVSTTPVEKSTFEEGLVERVGQARQKWESQEITSYRIVMEFFENFTAGLETQREVIVRNGQVISQKCLSDKCPAFILRDVYTIDDLFLIAQGAHLSDWVQDAPDDCVTEIIFDTVYGFPKSVSFDCPQVYDEDHSVSVMSFEALE